MTDAVRTVMLTMKDSKKLLRTAIRLLPEIPYVNKKQSNVLPFVLGAFGVAVAGGIAALFIFSPKTRTRALGIAKDTYGKVSGPDRGHPDRREARRPEGQQRPRPRLRVVERLKLIPSGAKAPAPGREQRRDALLTATFLSARDIPAFDEEGARAGFRGGVCAARAVYRFASRRS